MKQTLAIIGTGISAMGAAYLLRERFNITFYERNNYPGGHSNTLTVDEDGQPIYIDSAFMVYNEITYPLLTKLFKELQIETMATSMSFSVQHIPTGLEYCGTGLNGLFAQRQNLFNFQYWAMLLQMDRFNREAVRDLENPHFAQHTVKEYVHEKKLGDDFLQKFLIPMSSAVWSTPPEKVCDFPIKTLIQFFKNHGFLGLRGHYQWRTVVGGSRQYRDKILKLFPGKVWLNRAVNQVVRKDGKARITDGVGENKIFDKVVIACHADEALALLGDPTEKEKSLLAHFKYQKNSAMLHTDESVMPKTKLAWSSWNYRMDFDKNRKFLPSTIYHMNSLQNVSQKKNYFVSINEHGVVDSKKVLWETVYEHPLFDVPAMQAQEKLPELNENGVTYFTGSYFRYGFHEDGLLSAYNVAKLIGGENIWP